MFVYITLRTNDSIQLILDCGSGISSYCIMTRTIGQLSL